jgi:hypothetical protein
MRVLVAAMLGFGAPAVSAQAQMMTLAGFDVYRFGMSPQQVVTLPNTSWSAPQTVTFQRSDGALGMVYILRGQQPVPFDGQQFELSVFFDPQSGLNEVQLARRFSDRAVPECEREFQAQLKRFETRYGVFYPALPPGRAQEDWKVESPPLPGGGSRYALVTAAAQVSAGGVRRYGATSVRVGMSSDGRSTCALTLHFVKTD